MLPLLLLALAVAANAVSIETDKCVTGPWSSWGECTLMSKHCAAEPKVLPHTYQLEAALWDKGRVNMEYMMKHKEEMFAKKVQGRLDGTAPHLLRKPYSGSYTCTAGMAGDIPCENVDQLSFLSFTDMGYVNRPGETVAEGNDCWGWVDPQNNDEYAIMGISGGTAFVRITDPRVPVPAGIVYTATTYRIWRDIKVIGNYAYIVSEASQHGLQVFDLTRLRGSVTSQTFLPDAVETGFGNAHNIVANEKTNTVYVVGATQGGYPQTCRGGLYVINVADPKNPVYEGCYGGDGYVHDAQCVIYTGPDTRYTNKEICFCYNEDTFTIVDVTDRANMYMISKSAYDTSMYTHQGWITKDMKFALMDDEQDEVYAPSNQQFTHTYVWDIVNLQLPVLRTVFDHPERSIDHNQYITDNNMVYQANYESGLRVLSFDEATTTLTQVGYFDVYPSSTTADYYGSWSTFPYFPSGNVIISSIEYGLFVVRPNMVEMNHIIESGKSAGIMTRTRPLVSVEKNASCPPLVETKVCDAPKC